MALTRREIHARYEAHRPPRGDDYRAWKRDYQRINKDKNLLNQARYRARVSGLAFNITIDDIKIPIYCPYLKTKLEPATGLGPKYNSPTLDRIDNSQGYIKGNIEVISYRANLLKRDLSLAEMRLMGRALLKRANSKLPGGGL